MSQLTAPQMKYLHVMFQAKQRCGGIRSVDVAKEMRITQVSVCRMVKRLSAKGLILVRAGGKIDLTEDGMREGHAIHRGVVGIRPLFKEYFELDEPEATDSAYCFLADFPRRCVDILMEKGWAI